jgi:hypothetical protein
MKTILITLAPLLFLSISCRKAADRYVISTEKNGDMFLNPISTTDPRVLLAKNLVGTSGRSFDSAIFLKNDKYQSSYFSFPSARVKYVGADGDGLVDLILLDNGKSYVVKWNFENAEPSVSITERHTPTH